MRASNPAKPLTELFLFAVVLVAAPGSAQPDERLRKFAVEDVFQLEALDESQRGPFDFSLDGKKLAITRLRPKATLTDHKLDFLPTAGADVWVQLDPGQPLVNITNGNEDGSGWWAPQWSPDGQQLAMLSTRGGNVCLWTWNASTQALRQSTTRNIALSLARPYAWIDSGRLLYPALPPGRKPMQMQLEIQTPEIASVAWLKARLGTGVTASVLESGIVEPAGKRPQEELLVIGVHDSREEIVATGRTRAWQVAVDGRAIAFARSTGLQSPGEESEPGRRTTWDADVVEFTPGGTRIYRSIARDVISHTVQWSPSGKQLAALRFSAGHENLVLMRWQRARHQALKENLPEASTELSAYNTHRLTWADESQVTMRLVPRNPPKAGNGAGRRYDWWLSGKTGSPTCATCGMSAVPQEVRRTGGKRNSLLGIAIGDLWEILSSGGARNLTPSFAPKLQQFVPVSSEAAQQAVAFTAVEGDGRAGVFAWSRAHVPMPLSAPTRDSEAVLYSPDGATLLWESNDRNGLRVWRTEQEGSKAELLIEANQFLREIEPAEVRSVQYESLDGVPLTAWLILPAGYQPGVRYPLITWVYAGFTAGPSPPDECQIVSSHALNLQIPAARGYAVLIPSMPLQPEGTVDDPMLELQGGVMPAIDKIVAMAIADPDRLLLMGHSFGGYSAYGLITQTNRFKAAVAMAGMSNLVSLYGQLDARWRYTDTPLERLSVQKLLESGQGRMGSPPFQNLDRYLRNSPLFSVDRVQTPLLIIQGDLDYVPLQQGEEFFLALHRLGKRAQFVRYWGEGHVLQSPANIRDMWSRVFAWFDAFAPAPH